MRRLIGSVLACLGLALVGVPGAALALTSAEFVQVYSRIDRHYAEFEKLQRAAIADKLKLRVPFLHEPVARFDQTADQNACAPRTDAPTIFALLIAIRNETISLGGIDNDLPLLIRSLEVHGVDRAHMRVITEKTPRAALIGEFESLLACVRDGDQVFLYVHSDAYRQGDLVVTPFANPLPRARVVKDILTAFDCPNAVALEDPSCQILDQLWVFRDVIRDSLDRVQLRIAREFDPFGDLLILTGSRSADGALDGLRGIELANFITAVRNRRADAIVLMETPYAHSAGIQNRQRLAGTEWSQRIDGAVGGLTEDRDLSVLTRLRSLTGDYAVFYAAERDSVSVELPVGDDGSLKAQAGPAGHGKPFSVFTYAFAKTLQGPDRPSVAEIANSVVETLRSPFRQNVFFPRFEASSSELKVLAPRKPAEKRTEQIDVLSPRLTRGVAIIQEAELEVVARYRGSARPKLALIDGVATRIGNDGEFRLKLPLRPGKIEVPLVVIDETYGIHQRTLPYEAPDTAESVLAAGERYALVITNQNYRDPAFPVLRTPHKDGAAVAEILRKRFGFKTEIALRDGKTMPLVLHDANATDIIDALDTLVERLLPEDTLVVYYAGHGHYDKVAETAYWVGADARPRRTRDYVAASAISEALKRVPARNLMVIADSCYAGALTRSGSETDTGETRERALLKSAQKKKRILISSGGTEPVLDSGGGDHSIFAKALIDGLSQMDERMFSATELFARYLHPRVAGHADQEPQIAFIRDSGHDGGDFVFVQAR